MGRIRALRSRIGWPMQRALDGKARMSKEPLTIMKRMAGKLGAVRPSRIGKPPPEIAFAGTKTHNQKEQHKCNQNHKSNHRASPLHYTASWASPHSANGRKRDAPHESL